MPEYNMLARERLKSERGGGDKEGEEVERVTKGITGIAYWRDHPYCGDTRIHYIKLKLVNI